MLRYRITLTAGPNAGHSTTTELNEGAALAMAARGFRPGWQRSSTPDPTPEKIPGRRRS